MPLTPDELPVAHELDDRLALVAGILEDEATFDARWARVVNEIAVCRSLTRTLIANADSGLVNDLGPSRRFADLYPAPGPRPVHQYVPAAEAATDDDGDSDGALYADAMAGRWRPETGGDE